MKVHITNIIPDVPTINGRIYPRKVLEDAFAEYKDKPLFVVHSNEPNELVKLDRVGGIVKKYEILSTGISLDIKFLETPNGRLMQELLKHNTDEFTFTPCGIGTLTNKNKNLVVNDDYKILSINLISIRRI